MMDNSVTVQIRSTDGVMLGVAVVGERPGSITATNSSRESEYVIHITSGDNTELNARRGLEAAIPESYEQDGVFLYRQPVEVEELTDNYWLGTASYVTTSGLGEEIPPDTYSFDSTGGTQHITQSENTAVTVNIPANAIDYDGAIGVTDNAVQGVDIIVPGYKFAKTVSKDNADLTPEYLVSLARLTGRINDAPFLGFEAGEVLFLGATGSIQQVNGVNVEGRSDITMQFSASPNREDFTVGSITVPRKGGWDYMWVRYEYDDTDASKKLIQKPIAVYIEEVYLKGSFSILGVE